jgi:1,4-dihydroxy-2-naphthoyl-CoA synthase
MLFALEERILAVTLNRPENLNAFTKKMKVEITQFLADKAVDGDVDNWMTTNLQDPSAVDTTLAKRLMFTILDFPRRSLPS